MSDLRIVNFPHPALRWKSKDVNRIDAQLKNWIAQMFDLMYAARGIGLAANQVGLPYRLFVINPSADPAENVEFPGGVKATFEQIPGPQVDVAAPGLGFIQTCSFVLV
ncbi:MAG: hypothetical protein GY826_35385, partial [Fuerstiella sp.]|nr:hypothetical protein [Fuerstiella sp.]